MTERKNLSLDEEKKLEEKSNGEKIESDKEDFIKKIVDETNLSWHKTFSKKIYASFTRRALAYVIDLLIVYMLSDLFDRLSFGIFDKEMSTYIYSTLNVWIIHSIYFVAMTYNYGQTLGKMMFGIKVEGDTSATLKISDVLYREVAGRLINSVVFLTYLAVFFNSQKKGIHDYIADTVVIEEEYSELRKKINETK
ncbi:MULTISPECIES: RDD family protein [unclassified Gemella]|uniref:RDD family protein n=1 Tax=unclassified Gemella TaxID=2624949 RepID=UPI0010731232|nr:MULTISPECIES: RDD family protein [unclassified Gemella]MBF0710509.1 RDD family protein [Gemella sp. GL1.1]MBF0746549.1 RDD family protein [Gemella sp. 19428wG2_WT2a]NYS27853.1 RDD family protein [Gemella sp. GL1]TFU59910.1 RDD family protein [Gemella sp. WT2a]